MMLTEEKGEISVRAINYSKFKRPISLSVDDTHLHKVLINIEHHAQCLSPRRNWDSPNPTPLQVSVPSLPGPKSGGAHSPAAMGWESPNSDDWSKGLALCPLCSHLSSRNLTTPSTQMNGSDGD
jgi:hypothetical protein